MGQRLTVGTTEGFEVGATLGVLVGLIKVGSSVGAVGLSEGGRVGLEGALVGTEVGFEGATVGVIVGVVGLGVLVGRREGAGVGRFVRVKVGETVGRIVGDSVANTGIPYLNK